MAPSDTYRNSHGDLLFVTYKDKETAHIASNTNEEAEKLANGVPAGADPSTSQRTRPNPKKPWEMVVEDAVDVYWESKDGLIPRPRDRMCRHGEKSMCDHCMPLDVRIFCYSYKGRQAAMLTDCFDYTAFRPEISTRAQHQAPLIPCISSQA